MADDDAPVQGDKTPAPVTPPTRRPRNAAKKPAAKKPAAKKPAAKKPAAKKPAAKKPAPAKAAAKKPAAKKATAKKAAVKKPAAKKPESRTTGAARAEPHPSERAMVVSVTEDLLNGLVHVLVGEGVALDPLDTSVALPGMGEVDVRVALTITGGSVLPSVADDGRLRVVATASGDVTARSMAFTGGPDDVPIEAMGVPTPPAPIPVRVEALVRPVFEISADHKVLVGLDLRGATLVAIGIDDAAPVPDGVDAAAWRGMLTVFGMLFGALGAGLWDSLVEHVGTAGAELPRDVGDVLAQLGVAPGPGEVSVGSGLVTLALTGDESVQGRALPVPVAGGRLGVGLASSVVDRLAQLLLVRLAGDLPVPFELEVDLGEQQVGSRLRQPRLLPDLLPDFRSALRTEVRTRLVRGRLELSVESAWVELPSVLPPLFNQVSKRLGSLVSLAPIRVKFPATLDAPLPDGEKLPIRVDDLRVNQDGIGIVLSLA